MINEVPNRVHQASNRSGGVVQTTLILPNLLDEIIEEANSRRMSANEYILLLRAIEDVTIQEMGRHFILIRTATGIHQLLEDTKYLNSS
jgi:hypothetical protein